MNDTVWNTLSSTSPRPIKFELARTFGSLAWEENETERRIYTGLDVDETLIPAMERKVTQAIRPPPRTSRHGALNSYRWCWRVDVLFMIQPSIDMTAGNEHELEALLGFCSRMELLMGKWLAVATITGAGARRQIAGLLFAIGYLASSISFQRQVSR